VVDDAEVLRALRARAVEEAHIPLGFLAAITNGAGRRELTEMARSPTRGRPASLTTAVPSLPQA
jgi:hypothetical protein